jgi:hypothetical protein
MTTRERCAAALAADGKEAMYGKGGFWINGSGFFTLKEIAKQYGVIPESRVIHLRLGAYGDYATIAMLNGIKA